MAGWLSGRPLTTEQYSVASFLVLGGGGGEAPLNVPTEEKKIMYM